MASWDYAALRNAGGLVLLSSGLVLAACGGTDDPQRAPANFGGSAGTTNGGSSANGGSSGSGALGGSAGNGIGGANGG
ncbi:MAG: hypothetical protein KC492_05385, partial [Myxococcales bacterium]|nr:hypothetical protein [Myxococcales bacterium]